MNGGLLIYLMGPSGAGKDSLLAALRQIHVTETENLLTAHRYITRPLDWQDSEQHIPLSEKEFKIRRQRGLFALDWRSHGHSYAIGIEAELWMQKGFSVIINGSRQHLPQARKKYAGWLEPLCLTASVDVLRKRLAARGRENAEQIEQRIERALDYQTGLPKDCRYLCNEGDILETSQRFLRLFQDITLARKAGKPRFLAPLAPTEILFQKGRLI
ncbi:MAG: ribose 1,5-bisphosphokinase [Candidatus Accumulibacter sp.]|jgi:ribose 1,5-bisphosphokinase|nr:ribose 1,5-bisphosphokinase [Accumulibacter sp.]